MKPKKAHSWTGKVASVKEAAKDDAMVVMMYYCIVCRWVECNQINERINNAISTAKKRAELPVKTWCWNVRTRRAFSVPLVENESRRVYDSVGKLVQKYLNEG